MDSNNVLHMLDELDDHLDDLEDSLAPIVDEALATASSRLPLLDKAKLYILTTYAIESILYSYLRLHGVNAKKHKVFLELTRIKQYFDKIKTAENPEAKTANLVVDKQAAARFIKAGLSGNDNHDLNRAKREAESSSSHVKFEAASKKRKASLQDDTSTGVTNSSEPELQYQNHAKAIDASTSSFKAKERDGSLMKSVGQDSLPTSVLKEGKKGSSSSKKSKRKRNESRGK